MQPYLSRFMVYKDPTTPKQSILLNASSWYRSRSMIAGIISGTLLESTAMIMVRNPSTICILLCLATSYCFPLLIILSMFFIGVSSHQITNPLCCVMTVDLFMIVLSLLYTSTPNLPTNQEFTELEQMFVSAVKFSFTTVKIAPIDVRCKAQPKVIL
jgi:hypothetical protein